MEGMTGVQRDLFEAFLSCSGQPWEFLGAGARMPKHLWVLDSAPQHRLLGSRPEAALCIQEAPVCGGPVTRHGK